MPDPLSARDKKDWGITDYYFIDLILMLASSAQIDLGQLVHPYYKDKEVNLPRARTTINMISSLVKKTSGNLNVEEKKVLRQVLEDLQGAYVDKIKVDKSAALIKTGSASRPLIPTPQTSPKPNVKEWLEKVRQEMLEKKQGPPGKTK
jgi:hypothetical protein